LGIEGRGCRDSLGEMTWARVEWKRWKKREKGEVKDLAINPKI
jgi:hypothetical protein